MFQKLLITAVTACFSTMVSPASGAGISLEEYCKQIVIPEQTFENSIREEN